jgi:NCS2 family nucleobase:cation symporter-2
MDETIGGEMPKRPAGLIYGADDRPPFLTLCFLGFQHILLMSSTLVLPVVLVNEIGGSFGEVRTVVSLTMIACGLGTILQALRFPFLGSGFLCPNLCGPNFFSMSMAAAWLGGLPLMRGMTIVAGLVEALFARFLHRLKFLFPTEITGLVVLMVAESVIPLGTSKFLGISYEGEPIEMTNLVVASITLLVMVGINIWGKGRVKLFSVLTGMTLGYILSFTTGLLTLSQFRNVIEAPWMAIPLLDNVFDITFRWSLVPAFAIVSITGALKSFGNLILCEKVNDAEWSEPDMERIGRGLMADSLCVTISGVIGGVASDTSASNVALGSATGATSRFIGFAAGLFFIVLGFFPKIGAILSVMPMPVMGAILVFVVSYMVLSGMQIILGSGVEPKKIFVIGLAFIFGLSLDLTPSLYAGVPSWFRPLTESSLTLSTVLAVLLNRLLAIGARGGKAA